MRLKRCENLFGFFTATLFSILLLATFSLPIFSVSAADYVPLSPIPGTTCPAPAGSTASEIAACAGVSNGGTNLSTYLTGIFKVGIALAGVLAFLTIVWGGFTYLSTDAITGKEEGKAKVGRALGGLVLALAAYIILNTINPQLVRLNLNFGDRLNAKGGLLKPGDADLISTQTRLHNEAKATLDDATAKEAIAKEYRDAIERTDDEEIATEFGTEALKLEREAAMLRAEQGAKQPSELAVAFANKADLAQAKAQQSIMLNSYDSSIQKLGNLGDIEDVKKLELERFERLDTTATAIAQEAIKPSHANDSGTAKKMMDIVEQQAKTAMSQARVGFNDETLAQHIRAKADATIATIKTSCKEKNLNCRNWPN